MKITHTDRRQDDPGDSCTLIADKSCSYLGVHWCVFLATHFLCLQQSAREQMHDCLTETGLYPEQPWSGEGGWVTQLCLSSVGQGRCSWVPSLCKPAFLFAERRSATGKSVSSVRNMNCTRVSCLEIFSKYS